MKTRSIVKRIALISFVLALSIATPVFAKDTRDNYKVPEYSGAAYVDVNGGTPFFTEREKANTNAFESYKALDKLGRCGECYANIDKSLMPTEERGAIGSVKPSGWHTVKYPGIIDDLYLYNRCHLIAFCLTGENANKKNLITGTRYLNIDGMLEHETMVAKYIEKTGNHVLYRVTPKYTGDNLVADGVLMEGYSVEDKGKGINYCIFAYNVQPGIVIDYKTGDSKEDASYIGKNEQKPERKTETVAPTPAKEEAPMQSAGSQYILNRKTKKFHIPSCGSVKDMNESNKIPSNESRDSIISQGYVPCKKCNP